MGAEQEKWLFDNLANAKVDVDRDRPAGLFVRVRSREGGSAGTLLDGQVGRLRRRAPAALQPAGRNQAPNPIVCLATSISTTAPI
jgi:hypothetical protein